jgi:hypothetical protein
MSRLLVARGALRLLGLAVLLAAVGAGALLGATLGRDHLPLYAAVLVAALVLLAIVDRRLARRGGSPQSRGRSRQPAVQGAQNAYDLENDTSTDNQRYLM